MQRQMNVDQPDYGHLGRRGLAIEPGWIVLTGGLTDAVAIPQGAVLAAHFTHLGSLFLS